MKDSSFLGIWLPATAFTTHPLCALSAAERQLYCLIFGLSRATGYCYASNTRMAEMVNSSPHHVSDSVAKFKSLGLLLWRKVNDERQLIPLINMNEKANEKSLGSGNTGQTSGNTGQGVRKYGTPLITKRKQNKRQSRPSDGDTHGDEMPFIEALEPNDTNSPSKFDTECASILKEALIRKNRLTRPVSLKGWSNQFRILRKDAKKVNIKRSEIKSVLKWYCDHIGEPGVQQALCAESFRKKFDRIRLRSEMQVTSTPVEITDEAKEIVKTLTSHCHWPKGSKDQLPSVVQLSLDEYTTFRKAVRDLSKEHITPYKVGMTQTTNDKKRRKAVELARHLIQAIPGPAWFVEQWFRDISNQVSNWSEWSGNLRSMAVTWNSKRFVAVGQGWANDWCGETRNWDFMMEVLNEGRKA